MEYRHFRIVVSKWFRELIRRVYPVIGTSESDWAIMQLLVFGYEDEDGVVLPQKTVWSAVGDRSHRKSSVATVKEFADRIGLYVEFKEHRWVEGRATVAAVDWEPRIAAAMRTEFAIPTAEKEKAVVFTTGQPASTRAMERELKAHSDYLKSVCLEMEPDHPAYEFIDYHCSQHPGYAARFVRANMPDVRAAALSLYSGDALDRVLRQITRVEQMPVIYYKPGKRTARISAVGETIAGFPRELRRVALQGAHAFDIAYSQFAIAARVWGLVETTQYLMDSPRFWHDLADYCGVDVTLAKPTLKRASYSMLYGMAEEHIYNLIAYGSKTASCRELCGAGHKDAVAGLGERVAERYLDFFVVREALAARSKRFNEIRRNRGATDAFGRWIPLPWDRDEGTGKPRPNAPSVLAVQAQSYELDLMLSVLPVLRANRQIHCLLWLHDGIYLSLANQTKAERWVKQIIGAVESKAARLGIPTRLEAEYIAPQTQIELKMAA